MKASDLMIGDWVMFDGDYVQIVKVESDARYWDTEWKVTIMNARGKWVDSDTDNIEPIPLTAEILEKNGWYHAKFDGSYGRKAMRIDGYYQDELPKGVDNALSFAQWSIDEKFMYHMLEIFMWVGSIHLKIEYAHELQHALRLCGIEKEIKL